MADSAEDIAASLGITARPSDDSSGIAISSVPLVGRSSAKIQDRVPNAADDIAATLGITARPGSVPDISEKPITGTVRVPSGGDFSSQIIEGMPVVGPLVDKAVAAYDAATNRDGRSFGDRYGESLSGTQGANTQYARDNPGKALVGNLIGGYLLTRSMAGTSLGSRLLGLNGSTIGARVYSGLAGGAAIGATDAALRGEDPIKGAEVGGIAGGAAPVAGHALGQIVENL
jgi:hypothetical protein